MSEQPELTAPLQPVIRVLERLALMGPNLYAHFPCIKWKIDLGPLEQRPTNAIAGFADALKTQMPSLVTHRCSEGVEGGFFSRVDEGTWLGHVIEHIALELQTLIGVDVGFGRTRSTGGEGSGVYNVVYECDEREVGLLAGEIALEFVEHLVAGRTYDLGEKIEELRRLNDRRALGPSTRSIVNAALERGIPFMRLDESNLVQLGYGARAQKIQATIASTTRFLGVEIAGDKDKTKSILGFHGVPVPKGEACRTWQGALEIAGDIGWPVVVKPLDASHGRGIVTNIRDEEQLQLAFEEAKQFRSTIVVERFVDGADYRLLVIGGKLVAAAMRVPANVTGDGRHTIRELVDLANADPRRGESHEKVLTKIRIDAATERLLALRHTTLESVPADGEVVYLKSTANLSTGGTAIDVTDRVHPSNVELAERIAQLVDLDIAGIDIVAPVIDTPLEENGGAIVEVNAAPGFRMHLAPTEGKPRPVGEAVVNMLFPPGSEPRIPIITITGTNGKTTTARLAAHIARQAGKHVGLTTSDGIYIQNRLVQKGDTTGPASAAVVLRDPSVNFAVLETARGGLLRAGLGFDWSNAAVVTNIAEDHLGLRDIHNVEDLAHAKAVTVERVRPDGCAILNAEDAMTPLILEHVESRVAYFSLDSAHQTFREHVDGGGMGATIEKGWVVVYDKGLHFALCEVADVPIAFDGYARFNVANALAAVLATYATGIHVTDIRSGIMSFFQSAFTTPGRVNFVEFRGFRVMIDYAHNPHGIAALCELVEALRRGRLIAVLGIPGDRRDVDLRESARIVAQTFDRVIVREDFNRRGRAKGEVPAILRQALLAAGKKEDEIVMMLDEREALTLAVTEAQPGDLVVVFADKPEYAAAVLEELRRAHAPEIKPHAPPHAAH
jgi:cyanophycin synthetase